MFGMTWNLSKIIFIVAGQWQSLHLVEWWWKLPVLIPCVVLSALKCQEKSFSLSFYAHFLDEDEQQFSMLSSVNIIHCTNIEAVPLCGFTSNTKLTYIAACSVSLYMLSNSLMFLWLQEEQPADFAPLSPNHPFMIVLGEWHYCFVFNNSGILEY